MSQKVCQTIKHWSYFPVKYSVGYIYSTDDLYRSYCENNIKNNYIKMFDEDLRKSSEAMTEGMDQGIYSIGDIVRVNISDETLDSMRKYISIKRQYGGRIAIVIGKYLFPHAIKISARVLYTVLVGKDKVRIPENYLCKIEKS